MKILRIIARLNVGGPARHVVWLTKELNGGEFESRLIAGTVPQGEEDMGYVAEEAGVSPVYIPEMSRELSPKDVVSLYKVYRQMREVRPDIVHTHTAKAGTVGRTAALFYRWLTWRALLGRPRTIRVVHTFHGHVFHSYYGGLKTKVFLAIEKALARFATDKIVAITGQQFAEIHENFGVGRREQFEVIPLGIDLRAFENGERHRREFRRDIGTAEDEVLVGFVGRLTEIKNIPLYLKAAALYREADNGDLPKTRFLVVGDGHMRGRLERLASDLGLGESVSFLGNRADAERVYAGLDVVALTSLNEGTPLSLIEAMAAGRPVVSTSVGGVPDLLGETAEECGRFRVCRRGIAVESGDAQGFAHGLIYLVKNERLRESLSVEGRKFVGEIYSKERLVRDIKNLYRSMAA